MLNKPDIIPFPAEGIESLQGRKKGIAPSRWSVPLRAWRLPIPRMRGQREDSTLDTDDLSVTKRCRLRRFPVPIECKCDIRMYRIQAYCVRRENAKKFRFR